MEAARPPRASAWRTAVSRLLRDDQAEGAVAAALHHGHDDVRGRRPVARARGAHLPRRRAVGRRRGRDQPRARPRHRPRDAAHRGPAGGARAGLARRRRSCSGSRSAAPRSCCWRPPSTCSPPRSALSGLLGYVLVYTLWLKRTTPQNIVIGGAAGAVPPLVAWAAVTGGLDGRAALPVRDRLLLDAAALLGAVAADEGRVRARGRADAARWCAASARRAARSCSTPCCSYAVTQLPFARARSARPTWSPRCCSAPRSSPAPCRLTRRAERRYALRLYLFSLAYLAVLFAAMVVDVRL